MDLIRETGNREVGFKILVVFLITVGIVFLSFITAFLSGSPSIYAYVATIFFIESTILNGLIGFYIGKRNSKSLSKISIILSAISLVIGLILLFNSVTLVYRGFTDGVTIKHFEFALTVPILLIIITYITSEYIERKIPEEYWQTSRLLGDRIRGVISSSGVAIIGPTIAFFGILTLEPVFAVFVVLYAIVEAIRTVKEILYVKNKNVLIKTLDDVIEKTFKEIPSILDASVNYIDVSGKFIVVDVEADVSSLLEEEYIEDVRDFMYIELLSRLGTIIFLRVKVKRITPSEVYVAISVSEDGKVGEFPSEDVKIVKLDVKTGDELGEEDVNLKFDEYEKIPYARAVETIAKKGVSFIIAKEFNDIARNATRHWFIREIKVEGEDFKDALAKFKKAILTQ